jgi:hypothetical protein
MRCCDGSDGVTTVCFRSGKKIENSATTAPLAMQQYSRLFSRRLPVAERAKNCRCASWKLLFQKILCAFIQSTLIYPRRFSTTGVNTLGNKAKSSIRRIMNFCSGHRDLVNPRPVLGSKSSAYRLPSSGRHSGQS